MCLRIRRLPCSASPSFDHRWSSFEVRTLFMCAVEHNSELGVSTDMHLIRYEYIFAQRCGLFHGTPSETFF